MGPSQGKFPIKSKDFLFTCRKSYTVYFSIIKKQCTFTISLKSNLHAQKPFIEKAGFKLPATASLPTLLPPKCQLQTFRK